MVDSAQRRMTGSMSMTERRQALHAGKQAATSFFLVLILTFFFAPPSVLAKPDAAFAGAMLIVALSAFMLAFCHCHRRDFTSPRRVGRRI
jgi:hypothetical protein